MVTALALEPAGSANVYALQALERLLEVATFVCTMTAKPQRFEEGENVLL